MITRAMKLYYDLFVEQACMGRIFRNDGVDYRAIQSHAKEHVEGVYTQRKL